MYGRGPIFIFRSGQVLVEVNLLPPMFPPTRRIVRCVCDLFLSHVIDTRLSGSLSPSQYSLFHWQSSYERLASRPPHWCLWAKSGHPWNACLSTALSNVEENGFSKAESACGYFIATLKVNGFWESLLNSLPPFKYFCYAGRVVRRLALASERAWLWSRNWKKLFDCGVDIRKMFFSHPSFSSSLQSS